MLLASRLSLCLCRSLAQLDRERSSLAQLDWERSSLAPPSAATLVKPRQPSATSLYFQLPSKTSPCPRIRSSILQYTVTALPTLFLPGWADKTSTGPRAIVAPLAIVPAFGFPRQSRRRVSRASERRVRLKPVRRSKSNVRHARDEQIRSRCSRPPCSSVDRADDAPCLLEGRLSRRSTSRSHAARGSKVRHAPSVALPSLCPQNGGHSNVSRAESDQPELYPQALK